MPANVHAVPLQESGMLSALMHDYLFESKKLENLFSFPPKSDFVLDVVTLKKKHPVNRKLLVDVLQNQYRNFQTTELVQKNILSLTDENTFTVTAAHQPGLLLHPAYYVHKIASVISLANALSLEHPSLRFVPVFWLGSEDHDFDELGKAQIFNTQIVWRSECKGAIGRYNLAGMEQVIDEAEKLLPGIAFTSVMREGLRCCKTFGEFTRFLLNSLFEKFGLVILDQDDAKLKKSFSEIIKTEVLHQPAIKVLNHVINFLDKNYKTQATPREINFFYLSENDRSRIVNEGDDGFRILNNHRLFSREAILKEIEDYPENFSPNVIYRPVYQEFSLPNVAFVGGGAECSYWLQLKPLFNHFQIPFPLVLHRTPIAVIVPSVKKKIEKLGLDVKQIFKPLDALINDYLSQNASEILSLSEAKSDVDKVFEKVAAYASAVDPTLESSVKAERQKIMNAIEQLEGKMLKAHKRKNETIVAQLRSVHEAVFPEGIFQERNSSFLPNLQSEAFLSQLITVANPFRQEVILIELN